MNCFHHPFVEVRMWVWPTYDNQDDRQNGRRLSMSAMASQVHINSLNLSLNFKPRFENLKPRFKNFKPRFERKSAH